MADSYPLRAGEARALFFARGAECRSWQIGQRDMLWPGDETIWPGVAPVLFPVCGWSRNGEIRIGEARHAMPVHGFAAGATFSAEPLGEDTLRFTLDANAQTRVHYPFEFQLAITYRLEPSALCVDVSVTNAGEGPMPYAIGLHPGFAWNRQAGPHVLRFGAEERLDVPVIAPGGLFSSRRRPVPVKDRQLELTPALFEAEALCFLDVRERVFAFEGPEGTLRVEAPDFPHLVLWNRGEGAFLAIESWTGTGDPEGFESDFFARPSMIHLQPEACRTHHVRYSWEPLGRAGASP